MRQVVTALALGGLMLFNSPGMGSIPTHAASAVAGGGQPVTNPLVLTNPLTHSHVHLMPTTRWLAQHSSPHRSPAIGSAAPVVSGLPAPTCTLGTDNSPNDARVLVNSSVTQFDSLDLTAMGLSSDASNLTGQISVQSLSNGNPAGTPAVPALAGGGDNWYLIWNYGSDPSIKGYFLEVSYPGYPSDAGYVNDASTSNLPIDFKWGTITVSAAGSQTFNSGGGATGSFDVANNRMTMSAPLSHFGNAQVGSTLASPHAIGDALVGVKGGLLETADTLNSSWNDYKVGQSGASCPAPRADLKIPHLPTVGSTNNLTYYGGPIVQSITNRIIWWLPQAGTTTYSDGSACTIPGTLTYSYEQPASGTAPVGALPGGPHGDADYKAIIQNYFQDVGGTSFYNLLTQYADQETGATQNSTTYGGSWSDSCGYTSTPSTTTGPVPGGTQAAPIYQIDIQNEVEKAIQVNHWPVGLGNEYYVYTGYGVADCFSAPGPASLVPTCNVTGVKPVYCAYHGDFQDPSGNYVLYADMANAASAANPGPLNLCYSSPIGVTDPSHTVTINGQQSQVTDPIADAEVNITSHEQFETVNDAMVGTTNQLAPPLGWYDAANGEIGDKCAYKYGNYAADGSNIVLHGNHYIVQQEYSNWDNGCALTPYQNNGGYGGDKVVVPVQKGRNLLSVPVSGINDTGQLVSDMERPGQLPANSITKVEVYRNGQFVTYIPGQTAPFAISRTEGVRVTSNVAGTWTPTGTPYSDGPTINLVPGWNLVAATWPNPGLMTDSIYNQIAAEAGACKATILFNAPCDPTITEIKSIGANTSSIDWRPSSPDASGFATWPQSYGNQIPFTNSMWIYATKSLTWQVQGSQCNHVGVRGLCW